MSNSEKKNIVGKNLSIEWNYPDDLKSNFVTNIVVQNRPEHFVLSFFEVWPPTLLGPEEEVKSKLDEMETIQATCVARVVVSPQTMEEFIHVMSENFKKYQETIELIKKLGEE